MKAAIAFIIVFFAIGGAAASPNALQFSAASSKSVYVASEPVVLTTNLKNVSTYTLYLSPSWDGTVQILKVLRDGRPVAPVRRHVEREVNLGSALVDSLREVQAGKSISSGSGTDDGALRTVTYETPFTQSVTLFSVSAPGTYDITLRYQFPHIANYPNRAHAAPSLSTHVRLVVK